ncbi:MAG: DUF2167 domain-containing protein [Deltaproteobacteria bacterium]|nr:DUF2167 domain-containing protein [Kofleriaceae bacterium]
MKRVTRSSWRRCALSVGAASVLAALAMPSTARAQGEGEDEDAETALRELDASLRYQTGAILQYTDDGHVDDSDAASIDYDALLSQMKRASADAQLRGPHPRSRGRPRAQRGRHDP